MTAIIPFDFTDQLASQQAYFNSHSPTTLSFRLSQLSRLYSTILSHETDILAALHQDLGKNPDDAWITEIGICLSEIRYFQAHLKQLMKPKRVPTPWTLFPFSTSCIQYDPVGRVCIIGPWNYPFQLTILPLIGAIAAGNVVTIKPSENAPHTARIIEHIVSACFSKSYVTVIIGGADVTKALLAHPWGHVFFTGSPTVGRAIMRMASDYLTPVTLELGGKCPCLWDGSTDINLTAQRIAYGKFLNAGQTCIAPDFLLVPSTKKDAIIEMLIQHTMAYYGDKNGGFSRMGRIVNQQHFDRLVGYLDGGGIRWGGAFDRTTLQISPTIMDVSPSHLVMQEEIFGPILPIMGYSDLEEAFDLLSAYPNPLAMYVFTKDQALKKRVMATQMAGGITINDTLSHVANPCLPFGGVGGSGWGRYHGGASFLTFSNHKSIFIQPLRRWMGYRFPPYSRAMMALIRGVMGVGIWRSMWGYALKKGRANGFWDS